MSVFKNKLGQGELAILKTHTYSYVSRFFLQVKGGPIGLRSTHCVARLVMMWWDDNLVEAVETLGLDLDACSKTRLEDGGWDPGV